MVPTTPLPLEGSEMAPRIALLGGRPSVLKSASDLGCDVVLIQTPGVYDPEAAAAFCVQVVDTPLVDQEAAVAAGRKVFAEQPVVRFFSPAELGLVAAARLNEEFGLGGNSVETVRLLKDKAAMRRRLAEVGLSPSVSVSWRARRSCWSSSPNSRAR